MPTTAKIILAVDFTLNNIIVALAATKHSGFIHVYRKSTEQ
jgi:hypothetical protein